MIVLACISLLGLNLQGQEFEDFVRKYTGSNGQGFMQPLANAFGANLNSGWYHSAYVRPKGFQLYVGLTAMSAPIPEKFRTFTATTEGSFSPEQTAQVPTIFGSSETVYVEGEGGTTYPFPGGLDLSNLPLAVPNLSIGSLYGTDASFRWAGYNVGDEVGKVSLLGFGLRHSLDQYLPLKPVHMAVGFYYHQFGVGDIVDAQGWLANIQASYQWKFVTLFGGVGYENSTLDIQYTHEEDDSEISFDLTGDNNIRATFGLTFNLGALKIHSDYNLSSQSLFTLGLGVGINEMERTGGPNYESADL